MSMRDPGLDLHEWETEMEQLRPQLHDQPEAALPELSDLVGRMLEARGYVWAEEPTEEGQEPEFVVEYRSARETALRADAGEADPGDVGDAINTLRTLYDELVLERRAP